MKINVKNKNHLLFYLNSLTTKKTLMKFLQIKYININHDSLIGKMIIDTNKNFFQPEGFLHGGIITSLAESIGSSLSLIYVNQTLFNVFNIEISVNHIKNIKTGILFAVAKMIHKGKTLHCINVKILNNNKHIISFCKMTNIIISKKISHNNDRN
ncbi:PaaI family thioesterase [Blattabacterium cuenoti]|uniref:PaaI family thioesterase n=1 Tax=Blattabacterium cuenoti TaxID=1653831 RepID=UPI001EEAB7FA|nr:PaaI family thioesterase [Blattabacterium cuenoti]